MDIEQHRISFINSTMDLINNCCNDLYESLMDNDFESVEVNISTLNEILKDLNETFKNEI